MRTGGTRGNERLTASVAALLVALIAIELGTLVSLGRLLPVHLAVGIALIPVVGLKLASTGYRLVRYYAGSRGYRLAGPPHPLLRLLAPFLVASTAAVLGTGVALLATGRRTGGWVLAHQASFAVWGTLLAVHVLVYVWRVPRLAADRSTPGFALRLAAVGAVFVLGLWLADEVALHDRFT